MPTLADTTTAVPAELERLRDGRQRPARERAQRHRVDVDGEHDELVAARAGHEVPFRAEVVAEPARDGAQQLVADVVAEGVVDAAEPVEVEGADADRAARRARRARAVSRSASTARVARPVRGSWSAWKRRRDWRRKRSVTSSTRQIT